MTIKHKAERFVLNHFLAEWIDAPFQDIIDSLYKGDDEKYDILLFYVYEDVKLDDLAKEMEQMRNNLIETFS